MSSLASKRIGLIGLGAMGLPLGHHWQKFLSAKNASPLIYWNRTASKGDELKKLGAIAAESPAKLVQDCDVVFFSLSGDQVMKDLLDTIKPAVSGKLLCDLSTVHPETSKYTDEFARANGARFIACPMFGASVVAWKAALVLVPSGSKSDVDSISEYLGAVSKAVMYLGEDVTKSSVMKITGNVFITGLMELVAEVQAFGDANGVPAAKMTEWADTLWGPMLGFYFHKNSDGIYCPGKNASDPVFSIANAAKDMGYARQLAAEKKFNLPITDIMTNNLQEVREHLDHLKDTEIDASSVYGIARTHAGLDFETDTVKERDSS